MYKRILIPLDGSECGWQAVAAGLAFAKQVGASVTFLHVLEDPLSYLPSGMKAYAQLYEDMRRSSKELLAEASRRAKDMAVDARTVLVDATLSHPVEAILEAEREHDLTVMGTHGRRGVNRWVLGSVTEGVLRRSTKPQLVIRCSSPEQQIATAFRPDSLVSAPAEVSGV